MNRMPASYDTWKLDNGYDDKQILRDEWEDENCPVVLLKNETYLNTHTHRFMSRAEGEKAVAKQDRARSLKFDPPDDRGEDLW